ncbi:hypothetical protein FPS10_02800 [Pseudoruegeria sp. M32A2M]|nr:hypothetical protein [Pseudoruegeria sp. M32A2M]
MVDNSREFQAREAEELAQLTDGSAVVEMMGDLAILREQARACDQFSSCRSEHLHLLRRKNEIGTIFRKQYIRPRLHPILND